MEIRAKMTKMSVAFRKKVCALFMYVKGHHSQKLSAQREMSVRQDSFAQQTAPPQMSHLYTQADFIQEVQKCLGIVSGCLMDEEWQEKLVTVSARKNSRHPVVLPLQKKLQKEGYYKGAPDGRAGKMFTRAVNSYQGLVLGLSIPDQDGEITRGGVMWERLLRR